VVVLHLVDGRGDGGGEAVLGPALAGIQPGTKLTLLGAG